MPNPARPAMVMGLETEYSIYARGQSRTAPAKDGGQLKEMVDALIAEAFTDPLFTGPQLMVTHGQPHGLGWLHNGARLYNDMHSTPEYCTPECPRPDILVAHDQAGMLIEWRASLLAAQQLGYEIDLYKKNTDGHGHAYGCHENYCVSTRLWNKLFKGDVNLHQLIMATFFVVRPILTGAGKVGVENAVRTQPFQLSQRAEFISTFRSQITTSNRPILNERNEPHANADYWQRVHYIMGDANMCEASTYLKTGLTALMFMLLQDERNPGFHLPILDGQYPPMAHTVSLDPQFEARLPVQFATRDALYDTGTLPAPEILSRYLGRLAEYVQERPFQDAGEQAVYADVVARAQEYLATLRTGKIHRLYGVLDWPTKYALLENFLGKRGKTFADAAADDELRKKMRVYADHAFCSLDRERGLYFRLERAGHITRIVNDAQVLKATFQPPAGRPQLRTLLTDRFVGKIKDVDWAKVNIRSASGKSVTLKLNDPMLTVDDALIREIEGAKSPYELIQSIRRTNRTQIEIEE
ncbi:MAG TPA: proteasome accessory factor PafA2 family protein [Candidatus Paceibacterota bacterium]|nr:proteasome accessory factor PafA2 family protein [Candidatus Paceibacterota bacterium]